MKKLFLFVAVISLLFACNKDSDIPVHTISTIFPSSGPYSTAVTITGSGFSDVLSENIVTFNGKQAVVNSVSSTEIVAIVPELAGTGTVDVTIDGGRVVGPVFTYEYLFTVSTLAGAHYQFDIVDGAGSSARFKGPFGIDIDGDGNLIIADGTALRKVSPEGGVTTIAGSAVSGDIDGTGADAAFKSVEYIIVSNDGSYIVSDAVVHKVKIVSPSGGVITWVGGIYGYVDGTADIARFRFPKGVDMDHAGNTYVADIDNHVIRKITPSGVVSTHAGTGIPGNSNGDALEASFNYPECLLTLDDGTMIIVDKDNFSLRLIDPSGSVSTLAGNGSAGSADGPPGVAQFKRLRGICVGHDGAYYLTDEPNFSIRRVTSDGTTSTFAGGTSGYEDGAISIAKFGSVHGIAYDSNRHAYYVCDARGLLRKIQIQ